MAGKSKFVGFFKKRLDIKTWSDVSRIDAARKYIIFGIKKLCSAPKPPEKSEDFESILIRFAVTPEELNKKYQGLINSAISMLIISLIVFAYFIYVLIHKHWSSAILSLVVSLIALTLAFRYHFWSFQIKNKRLGISFQEWLDYIKRKNK